ncbi:MAG: hypothetical protein QHH26_04830 [Armatimonadota bacterium]|nr:hypothetical protein [Armatimonadota bacterium]
MAFVLALLVSVSLALFGFPVHAEQAAMIAKPPCSGVYVDRDGVKHPWHVNQAHTLIWDGRPYLPVGGMYCPPYIWEQNETGWQLTKNQIDMLKEKGVIDIYIHFCMACPPECLQRVIDYLEVKGFRYGIELADGPGPGVGYLVQNEGLKVDGITRSGTYGVECPDAISGIYVLLDGQTCEIVDAGWAKIYEREEPTGKNLSNGQPEIVKKKGLEVDVHCPPNRTLCLCFTPKVIGGQPYFWEGGLEKYQEKLLKHFSKVKFGKGFRFVVDPLQNEMNISHTFLPASQEYGRQFARWLVARYGSIEKLNEAWAATSKIPDFETAGRFVPIRVVETCKPSAIGVFFDPNTGKIYKTDAKRSQAWYDFIDFLGERVARYCNALCKFFKERIADVPIVFKHSGPIATYRINPEQAGFDGIGMEAYGVGETLIPMNAAVCWSEVEQSARNMWLVVTEFSQAAFENQLENIGHMDRESMYADMSALLGAGAKGIFVFGLAFGPWNSGQFWKSEFIRDPRQLEWIATFRRIIESSTKLPDYRPTYYYRFPARRMEASAFSLPLSDFVGIDGGWTGYSGGNSRAIMRGPDGTWILPTWTTSVDTPLIIANLNDSPASLKYGAELERIIEAGKPLLTYIGFRLDLGAIPSLDKYFTSKFATDADGRRIQVLNPGPKSEVLSKSPDGHVWNMIEGNLQIISKEVEDKEGWQPEGLRIPLVDQIHQPERFLAEVLGVREFRLDPDIRGFSFTLAGRPITYLWSEKMKSSIRISPEKANKVKARYANSEKAGGKAKDGSLNLRIPLKRQPEIVEVDVPYIRGKHCPTEKWEEALIIDGLAPEDIAKPEEIFPAYQAPNCPPNIWIEAEDFIDSNFNLGKYGGMTRLSNGALWALDTFVDPSPETGYYAKYTFKSQQAGEFDLWVREWVGKSPCHWVVNGGRWTLAPDKLEEHDKQFCGPWALYDDSKIVFAWRNYGKAQLREGDNTLEIRVIAKRKKGDKYCKFLDAFAFTTGGVKPWEIDW